MPPKKDESKDTVQTKSEQVGIDRIAGCVVTRNGKNVVVDSVWASAGVTLNTGDYESTRLDFGVTLKPVDADTDIDDMAGLAWDIVKGEVSKHAKEVREKTRKKA